MSWLSRLVDKIFGRKKGPLKSAQAASQLSRSNKVPHSKRVVDMGAGYAQNSMGHVLKHTPRPTPAMHLYDLNAPPAIASDARDHLQARITQIPPMPEIWRRVQNILQRDDASASDLGQCVAQDPVLTAHILKVCNSASYAAAGAVEISNIPLAIARLGLDEASSIIFRSLAPDLGGSEQRKKEIRHIWFHSQAIAMLSRILAEPAGKVSRHDATLIGMLHDIGKLVILHLEDEQKLKHLKALINQGKPGLIAEQETLGYTHIDAGMMLALHWRLPKLVQHSIAFHHHATVMKADRLPSDLQHAMLTLHTAHLVLQHVVHQQPVPQKKDEEMMQERSIWHLHLRTCLHETDVFVQQEMLISLESESLYGQIEAEIERLKLSFPDLFGCTPAEISVI